MRKFMFLMVCLLGLATTVSAQGNSKASRSINEIRQSGCAASFFQGNTWDISATYEMTVRCEVGPAIDGTGDVYLVVASYHCRSEICPAIADMIIGRVFWCGNDIVGYECTQP
ncbi:MAG: hypothetical protein IPN95_30595 [Bacteroidetes bacterium]|nr:hypothetical protein [Bacteroidota bacterium]MBL0017473.1 hypothetical protein [Bacteroidota bacterium]